MRYLSYAVNNFWQFYLHSSLLFIHFRKFFGMSKKNKVSSKKEKGKSKDKKPGKKNSKSNSSVKKKEKKPAHKQSVKKPAPKKLSSAKGKTKAPAKKNKKAAKPVSKVLKSKALPKKAAAVKKTKPAVKPKAAKITKSSAPVKNTKTKVGPASTVKSKTSPVKSNNTSKPVSSKKDSPSPKTEGPVQSVFTKTVKKTPDVLAVQNTLPVKSKEEISQSKIASISSSITNPSKKPESYSIKAEKEPSGKFEMEFVIHASAEMLYEFLSTPSGLSEWFCDDLNIRNGIYTFIWDDQLMQARLLKTSELQLVRFQWVDKTDGSYFEFRIQKDDLTNDISLIITDFAETASDRESAKRLWQSQIEKLRHVIGSIF